MAKQFIFVDSNGDYEESAGAYEQSDFINSSAGVADAGKPIVLDAAGKIDASMLDFGAIDHGSLSGLGDDDHTQYILVDGTRAFTGDQSMGSNQLTNVGDPTVLTIDSASDDAIPMSLLASTANGEGAAVIGIEDASSYYTGTSMEAALNELEAQIGGTTSSTFDFTENNVLADNDAIYAALEKLDLKHGDYASNANGEGASLIGIEDAASNFTATDVEGALSELYTLASNEYDQEVSNTGANVDAGDLVYFSANDTVSPMPISSNNYGVGIALETVLSGNPVKFAANDAVVTGVLTAATAGDKYYWDGSALTATIPSGSGQYVWQAGVAKNATDLLIKLKFVKKNA